MIGVADFFGAMTEVRSHRLLVLNDEPSGLRAVIAIDDVTLGPACGGIRTRAYRSLEDGMADAAALASAMTRKCAIAGLDAGGGKTVVFDHAGMDREAAFYRLGQYIEDLGGLYRSAGDLGTTPSDLANVRRATLLVDMAGAQLGTATAVSVVNGIRACMTHRTGRDDADDLSDLKVAVQGCGLIGSEVARMLAQRGVTVLVADPDKDRAVAVADETGAQLVDPHSILSSEVDIVAPCAIGGVIDEDVAETMKAWAVCGGANNQLSTPGVATRLKARGVLFVPDFLASSGAVIHGLARNLMLVDEEPLLAATYDTAVTILAQAETSGRDTVKIAEEIALNRIRAGRELREAAQ